MRPAERQEWATAPSSAGWAGIGREGLIGSCSECLGTVREGGDLRLQPEQLEELWKRSAQGEFRSYEEARQWVLQRYGVGYSYNGMRMLLAMPTIHPKVPRPIAAKADPQAQEAWKRGGLG